MKNIGIVLLITFALPTLAQRISKSQPDYSLLIGTYTKRDSKGIYVFDFDSSTGKCSYRHEIGNIENPSYMVLTDSGDRLYAVSEKQEGAVHAFAMDGNLRFLNSVSIKSADPCYIDVAPDGRYLAVANYTGSSVSVLPISSQSGQVEYLTDQILHQGHGPRADRQEHPHPHFAKFIKERSELWVADLGTDKIVRYKLTENGKLTLLDETALPPGSGPRHIAINVDASIAYVICELNSSVVVLKVGEQLMQVQKISTLPKSFGGDNYCADIHLSADGRYLYGSNRGHDSIVCYKVLEDGKLKMRQVVSSGGKWPRNFMIDPTNQYLLVANQESDNIVVFKRSKKSGKIKPTGEAISVSMPVCLIMAKK